MRNFTISITILYLLLNIVLNYLLVNSKGGNGLGYLLITPTFWLFYFLAFSITASFYKDKTKITNNNIHNTLKILILINVIITVFFIYRFITIIN